MCRRLALLLLAAFVFTLPSVAQAGFADPTDWARARLDQSTRHREYVPIKVGGRTINTLVIYPERSTKAPVVVLIHEIFGLSTWMKLQADELAGEGYIVLAPDLLSGLGANGGGTDAMPSQDAVVQAVMKLDPAEVTADLDAVADYGQSVPSATKTLFVAGFCWGGGKTFAFATHRQNLAAAFVFYGPPPPAADMVGISAPVYGFYGGNDARIDATIPATQTDMAAAHKYYQPETYADAGHGFMRAGQAPNARPADSKAFADAFARLLLQMHAHTHRDAHTTKHGLLRQASPAHVVPVSASSPVGAHCHDTGM